jgi:gliding motility associated protien GldN
MKEIIRFGWMFFLAFSTLVTLYAQESNESNETNEGSLPGQGPGGGAQFESPRDGAYDKIGVKERIPLSYDEIREADVLWAKRLWRVIDTREKMNEPFVNSSNPFVSVLIDIISKNPDVQLFNDDQFKELLTYEDVQKKIASVDTLEVLNPDTYEYEKKIVKNDFNPTTIQKFRVKEDWIFDEETSTMVCRIIGIAPLRDVTDDNGNYRGQEVMFWIHYPSMRKYLARQPVFSNENDLEIATWEDIFEERRFASYIMKENNAKGIRISEYADGRDALMESERIKKEIFEKEHDLWEY